MKKELGNYDIYNQFQVMQTSHCIFKGREDIFKQTGFLPASNRLQ